MLRLNDQIVQHYNNTRTGNNGTAAMSQKRKIDDDGFTVPVKRPLRDSSKYRPIAAAASTRMSQQLQRDDRPQQSSSSRRDLLQREQSQLEEPQQHQAPHSSQDDFVNDSDEDIFEFDGFNGSSNHNTIDDEQQSPSSPPRDRSSQQLHDEDRRSLLSSSSQNRSKYHEQQRLLEELEDDRRQHLLETIDTASFADESPVPQQQQQQQQRTANRWPRAVSVAGSAGRISDEDNFGGRDVDAAGSDTIAATTDAGVNWADVMNSFTREMKKKRQESPHCLRPILPSDDCVDIGDSYARACWSLVAHLDDDMCALAFGVNDHEKPRLIATMTKIRAHLRSIRRCAAYIGVDPQFELPARVDREDALTNDNDDASSNDNESSDPARWSRDKWVALKRDDSVKADRALLQLTMLLDYELRKLCRLPCAGSMMRENLDARSINFASVNAPFSKEHSDYMKMRMECTGYYDAKSNGKTVTRMGMKGSFLISLRNSDQTMLKNSKLNYPAWADLDGSLNRVVEEFSREFMKINATVRVFLNVSMRKDTRHYRVLNTATPSDGVLAMLDLAHATYDPTKRIVSVKAYITCTMSATNSPPK